MWKKIFLLLILLQANTYAAEVINCQYHTPPTQTIEPAVLKSWASNAAMQTFSFDAAKLDEQLKSLQDCFTAEGWKSFQDALQKSGNLNAIKTQKLTVVAKVSGEVTVNPAQNNQWKAIIPMDVLYQDSKQKMTQKLTVDLLIGKKPSGDLGIMQVIAASSPNPGDKP